MLFKHKSDSSLWLKFLTVKSGNQWPIFYPFPLLVNKFNLQNLCNLWLHTLVFLRVLRGKNSRIIPPQSKPYKPCFKIDATRFKLYRTHLKVELTTPKLYQTLQNRSKTHKTHNLFLYLNHLRALCGHFYLFYFPWNQMVCGKKVLGCRPTFFSFAKIVMRRWCLYFATSLEPLLYKRVMYVKS